MSAKECRLLLLVMLLITTGCVGKWVKPTGGAAEPKRLDDPGAIVALDEWAQSLGGIEKSLRGEVAYVAVIQPVVVLSPMRRAEVEATGFGQKAGFRGEGSNVHFKFETPLDKCNWLSHLISYPLGFKLDIAPGVRLAQIGQGLSFDRVGAAVFDYWFSPTGNVNGNGPGTGNMLSGFTIDDIYAWKADLQISHQAFRNLPEGVSPLCVATAIEVPGGDAWFDDMNTAFQGDETFTFHVKAFREGHPENVAHGKVELKYIDILPFLTEVAAKVASTQGFYELTPKQIGWLSREPVTNIRAWADFLEAYAKRTWEYVDVMPSHTKSGEYLDKTYDALDNADPGNTLSLLQRSHSESAQGRDQTALWERAVKNKPYFPIAYESLLQARTAQAAKKKADYDPSELWEEAVKARPDVAKFHMYHAGTLLKHGNFDKAVAEYKTSGRMEPGMWLAYWHAWSYMHGKFGGTTTLADEIRFGEMVVTDHPDDQGERQYLATLYINGKDWARAREQYEYKKDLTIGGNLAKEYKANGMTAEAIGIYEDLVRVRPDYVSNWRDLADGYKSQGDVANELRALEGFIANVDPNNSGYADDISKIKGRIAALKGDTAGQIQNLLANFPSYTSGDPLYLDLAEAIHKEGYTADALYLTFLVLGDLSFRSGRFMPKEKAVYDRAVELKGKLIKEFWPEYDPSKMLPSNAYPSPYTELKNKKKVVGVREIIPEYRKLLDNYPSTIEVDQYVLMVQQVYKDDLDALLNAKLLQAIITDSGRSLDHWDEYNQYLKENLEKKYGT